MDRKHINVVITAGGTSEDIDKVRRITNTSTGRLGVEILEEVLKQNPEVTVHYICSSYAVQPKENKDVNIIHANSVEEVKTAIENVLTNNKIDLFIHSMAISDYTVDYVTNKKLIKDTIEEVGNLDEALDNPRKIDKANKISSDMDNLIIVLKKSPKLISMIKNLSPETFLVGFKLLDGVKEEELITVGHNLLKKNNCDLVLANDLSFIREGGHKGHVIYPDKSYHTFEGKDKIASNLIKIMLLRSF